METYEITLESQLGPRKGTLLLNVIGKEVTGTLSLLGFDNPVCGQWISGRHLRLLHHLRTRMSDIPCESTLELIQGNLTGTANTSKGKMPWHGRKLDGNIPADKQEQKP